MSRTRRKGLRRKGKRRKGIKRKATSWRKKILLRKKLMRWFLGRSSMREKFFFKISQSYLTGRKKWSLCRRLALFRDDIPESDNEIESYEAKYRDLKNEYNTINRSEGRVNRLVFSLGELIGYDLLEKK